MAYPNMSIYLDSGLIPSLGGESGGSVGHHALMGRPILPTFPPHAAAPKAARTTKPLNIPPRRTGSGERRKKGAATADEGSDGEVTARPSKSLRSKAEREPRVEGGLKGLKKGRLQAHRRTSSMDGRISSTTTTIPAAKQDIPIRPRLPQIPRSVPSATSAPEPGQYLVHSKRVEPSPPPSIHLSPPPETARHARSSSWSAPPTARQSCIPLYPSSRSHSPLDPVDLLEDLRHLVPPSRLDPLAPPPSSSSLHPPTLLAGLAFILEALVSERQTLSSPGTQDPEARLPLLRDRSSLQCKSGELNWAVTHKYLISFGELLEGLMEMLMDCEVSEASLGLVEMVRTYIDKTRKVFGEVAGLYMDGYSFMAGWWDEDGMRRSAREVGKWSDIPGVRL